MATKTIPELNEVTSIDENTLFPIDTGTQTFKLTAANLAEYIAATIIPVGTTVPYAGTSAPSGWLLANGSAISRTTYSRLFDVIGETFGAGDGSTTFNLPDLRGRVTAGKDNMGGTEANRLTNSGSGVTGTTLGASGGGQVQSALGTIGGSQSIAHTHNIAHVHQWAYNSTSFIHSLIGIDDSVGTFTTTSPGTNVAANTNVYTTTGSSFGSFWQGSARPMYTGGVLSPPSGSNGASAASGAMSANATVNGSNFSFTGTPSNVVQPTIVLNQIIKV